MWHNTLLPAFRPLEGLSLPRMRLFSGFSFSGCMVVSIVPVHQILRTGGLALWSGCTGKFCWPPAWALDGYLQTCFRANCSRGSQDSCHGLRGGTWGSQDSGLRVTDNRWQAWQRQQRQEDGRGEAADVRRKVEDAISIPAFAVRERLQHKAEFS